MRYFLMFSVAFGLIAPGLAAEGFPLRVNDVSGVKEPWPLVAGLPFREGSLRDASAIKILCEDREVPAQIDLAATWRDGSVRWALAAFAGNPQRAYRVEYGPGVKRQAPAPPLTLHREADGGLAVNTGAALYAFVPDRLMPERAILGDVTVLPGSGDGAYLVDNRGRTGRVAGAKAEVNSEILKQGPARLVLRREGWYVTPEGDRLARARAWFYFAVGSPFLKVTHSLVLTEDTNKLRVRDYGLEFRIPAAPERVAFALGALGAEELYPTRPDGADVFMLQETYPHFLERESRAVVGRASGEGMKTSAERPAAGDWADAAYDGYGLTVVVPWLAQQFPKEIAFGPAGARVALWSGRSRRELDFRAKTLVEEYWRGWAARLVANADANIVPWIEKYWKLDRKPEGAEALAEWPSNAQCAARTHDVWLLPRKSDVDDAALRARAVAAARPPLVMAEPAWLTETEAIGWPMRHKDPETFPRAEALISRYWDTLMAQFDSLPRTGLIAWGGQPYLSTGKMFRQGILCDYGLRRSVWGLYARSGERRYYEYGSRFNRHIADWWVAHWTAGAKVRGGFVSPGGYWQGHMPFIWGDRTEPLSADSSGHDVHNWLMEHYLTGDEYALHVCLMVGEATREHWWSEDQLRRETGEVLKRWHIPLVLRRLACLYADEWNGDFARMARDLSKHLIELDSPNGLTDKMSGGALYKWERNVHSLYEVYRTTGDESARKAMLKALDYNYRFNLVRPPFHSTNHAAFLYTIAYRWTGRRGYLRLVNQLVQDSLEKERLPRGPHTCAHPTMGVPAALDLLAEIEEPIAPFPLLNFEQKDEATVVLFRKPADRAVEMSVYVRLSRNADRDAEAAVEVARRGSNADGPRPQTVRLREERAFRSAQPVSQGYERDRHIRLAIPADAPATLYSLKFTNASRVRILESDAPEIRLDIAKSVAKATQR